MIKAEVISHEGNPGPNWLDRCRTLITPSSISTLIVVVAIVGLVVGISHKHATQAAAHAASGLTSQPAPSASPLSVQPLNTESYQTTVNDPALQSAPGGTTGSSANGESPLNSTATTPDANQHASYNQQGALRRRNLTNDVQSTVRSIHSILKGNNRL